jgi:hypothetical protein
VGWSDLRYWASHEQVDAFVGGLLGIAFSELVASPQGQMVASQALAGTPRVLPFVLPVFRYGASRLNRVNENPLPQQPPANPLQAKPPDYSHLGAVFVDR